MNIFIWTAWNLPLNRNEKIQLISNKNLFDRLLNEMVYLILFKYLIDSTLSATSCR